MAYDSDRRVTVLYGGYSPATPSGYKDDTWEWDGLAWTQKTPANTPGRRSNHKMCYDSDRKLVYLWGGESDVPPSQRADLWAYDGSNWTLLNDTLTAYSAGYPTTTPEIAYDSVRHRLVLVRNRAGTTQNSETYEYDPVTNQWELVWANNGFPAGYGGAIGFDSLRNLTVHYFAGTNTPNVSARWNGTAWTPDSTPFFARPFAHIAYDSTRQQLVLFGGTFGSVLYQTDSYYYTGSMWNLLLPAGPPFSPPPSTALPMGMAYDSHRRAMVSVLLPYNGSFGGPLETWEYRYLDRVVFDRQPQSQPLDSGGNASFGVVAAGYGTLSYQWYRNGQAIADGPAPGGGAISGADTPTLTLTGVQEADGGIYTCEVSNDCGSALSNGALLGMTVASDFDGDGDVDLDDMAAFVACELGANVPPAPGCADQDLDGDGDVDLLDFGILQRCFSGDGNPVDPNCAD